MLLKSTKVFPWSTLFRALIGVHRGRSVCRGNHKRVPPPWAELTLSAGPGLGAAGRWRQPLEEGGWRQNSMKIACSLLSLGSRTCFRGALVLSKIPLVEGLSQDISIPIRPYRCHNLQETVFRLLSYCSQQHTHFYTLLFGVGLRVSNLTSPLPAGFLFGADEREREIEKLKEGEKTYSFLFSCFLLTSPQPWPFTPRATVGPIFLLLLSVPEITSLRPTYPPRYTRRQNILLRGLSPSPRGPLLQESRFQHPHHLNFVSQALRVIYTFCNYYLLIPQCSLFAF